ncbi:MAG: AarF/UbiB family protein [Caldilineaceae bacterium]
MQQETAQVTQPALEHRHLPPATAGDTNDPDNAAINGQPPGQDRRRYRRILRFFAGVIGQFIVLDLLLGRIPGLRQRIRASRTGRLRHIARRFRALAIEMGGVLIKLGQFLSARVDVLPAEITDELAGLQDEVPAVPWPAIQATLQHELGELTTHFTDLEETPLAAASLGQAHRARLHMGKNATQILRVVIKVQRPGIEAIVRTDLEALRVVARWIMRYRPIRRRANVPALMEEFARTLWEELDYQAEAANAERFAKLFVDAADVRVPVVYHAYSTGRILTLENVEGLRIDDVAGMAAAGVSPTIVAERLLDIYFKQVFQEGFFHADPHPGNIFVHPLPRPADLPPDVLTPFQITFVDFGMMGNIQTLMGENLRRVLLAVAKRDAHALTQIYSDMGFFLPGADLDRITAAQEAVLGRIWGRSLQEMARPNREEIQELGSEFKDLLREFPFQVPQDFIYLGRAVGMLSGLTSQLHPDVNLWTQMEKYALEIVGDERFKLFSPELILDELRALVAVPAQVRRLIHLAETGQLQVRTLEDSGAMRRLDRLERRVNRLNSTMVASAALLTGALLYNSGSVVIALAFWGVAGVLLVAGLFE